ncbi:MAG: glycosyltransferase [Bacillota bacterium]
MQFSNAFRPDNILSTHGGTWLSLCVALLLVITLWYWLAKKYEIMKNPFAVFATLLQLVYVIWRFGFTLPTISVFGFTLGLLLVLMETMGFTQAATYRMLYMRKPYRTKRRLSDLPYLPTVDVMITTYNEPVKVIRRTVAAASRLDYPGNKFTVYVCDDGSRESIRAICEEYGAKWITREEHKHAKAGNLNNCFKNHATGEFAVILDADMVPKSDFLQKTLGYFCESDIAFVQTPQVFFNPDPFQHNLKLERNIPNEQDFFMQEVQIQRQEYNALLFVGSGCVFRRKHLDEIGLIPTGTITEDMATSLLLQDKGYRGVLVTDTFAQGLSAETFSDHITQRTRWCQGNIQVLRKWNPWRMKGLDFFQKQIITDGVTYWFFGLQKMVYIICPIFYLLTGLPIYMSDIFVMLFFMLPTFYASALSFRMLSHKNRTWGWAHIYETALAPYLAFAALSELLFPRGKAFKVTPKGVSHEKTIFLFKVALPHIVLTALSVTALFAGTYKLLTDSDYMIIVYALNMGWVIYNLFALVLSIVICFEKPRVRNHDRLVVSQPVNVRFGNLQCAGKLINISEGGCNVIPQYSTDVLPRYEREIIRLYLGDTEVMGRILRYIPGKKSYAVQFLDMESDTYARLVQYIFNNQDAGFGRFASKSVMKTLGESIAESVRAHAAKRRYRRMQEQKKEVIVPETPKKAGAGYGKDA